MFKKHKTTEFDFIAEHKRHVFSYSRDSNIERLPHARNVQMSDQVEENVVVKAASKRQYIPQTCPGKHLPLTAAGSRISKKVNE